MISFVRTLGLQTACYNRLLGFSHSLALDLGALMRLWVASALMLHPLK